MQKIFRNHWPIICAITVCWGIAAIMLMTTLRQTGGHLVYALDDAYIHMAMAKNLAQHAVYGVTQYEFSSSSSSPLWTVFVALFFKLFGVHEAIPWLINLLLSSFILVIAYSSLNMAGLSRLTNAIALLAIAFFTPFCALIFSGMEHTLQIFLVIVFVSKFARMTAANERAPATLDYFVLSLLTVGLVLVRYESYAILLIAGILSLIRRRWTLAFVLLISGTVPLIAYQELSVAHGGLWLPNSILIRTGGSGTSLATSSGNVIIPPAFLSHLSHSMTAFLRNANEGSHVSALVLVSSLFLITSLKRADPFWSTSRIMTIVFVVVALLHLAFGKIGHFFRYEAYLVALGLFVLFHLAPDVLVWGKLQMSRKWSTSIVGSSIVILSVLSLGLLSVRAVNSLTLTPVASRNIYEQQYQMGNFLRRYYSGSSVALNDIGAVSFLADVHLVDLIGLASADIIRLKQSGHYDAPHIRTVCAEHNVRIATIYDSWFRDKDVDQIPTDWMKTGSWKIQHNVICSDDMVSFYAVGSPEKENLLRNLREYSSVIPTDVEQTGLYLDSQSQVRLNEVK